MDLEEGIQRYVYELENQQDSEEGSSSVWEDEEKVMEEMKKQTFDVDLEAGWQ